MGDGARVEFAAKADVLIQAPKEYRCNCQSAG